MSHCTLTKTPSKVELIRKFIKFEEENSLFNIKVKGHPLWDYIRYIVFYELIFADSGFGYSASRKRNYVKYLKNMFRCATDLFSIVLKGGKKIDILLYYYDRTSAMDGKNVNIHMYPIALSLEGKYRLLIIDPHSGIKNRSDYPCEIFRIQPIILFQKFLSLLIQFSRKEKKLFADLKQKITTTFFIEIPIETIVRKYFAYQISCHRVYNKLLKKFKPRIALFCDNGNMKSFLEAARKQNVITIDLQHSLISSLSLQYHYHPDVSHGQLQPTIPDYIFSFGKFWKSEFRIPVKIIPVGFPFFDIQSKPYQRTSQDKSKNIILISGLFSKNDFVKITIELADLLPDYNIYYKLRIEDYIDWQNRYPEEFVKKKNIIVIDNNEIPLYKYFSICAYQIGTNSTALYEGMGFGLTTFILKTGMYEEMKYLYESGHVFLVSSSREIAHNINTNMKPENPMDKDEIFRRGSQQRMNTLIETLMEGGYL